MKTQLLVMAAGMGSRFGGVKQIAGVGPAGESVLEYSVYDAIAAGFNEIVFLIRSSIADDFRKTILSRLPANLSYRLAYQETDSLLERKELLSAGDRRKPWGTGHAILCAAKYLDAPFAVINADDFYGRSALQIVHEHLAARGAASRDLCMAGYELRNVVSPYGPVSRGICDVDAAGRLRGVTEHFSISNEDGRLVSLNSAGVKTELPPNAMVSMNLWGLSPAIFPPADAMFRAFLAKNSASATAEFYLPTIVDTLVHEGTIRVDVLPTSEKHFGLTYRGDLDESRVRIASHIAQGLYPSPLWADAAIAAFSGGPSV